MFLRKTSADTVHSLPDSSAFTSLDSFDYPTISLQPTFWCYLFVPYYSQPGLLWTTLYCRQRLLRPSDQCLLLLRSEKYDTADQVEQCTYLSHAANSHNKRWVRMEHFQHLPPQAVLKASCFWLFAGLHTWGMPDRLTRILHLTLQ